jgi:hypothetical protein
MSAECLFVDPISDLAVLASNESPLEKFVQSVREPLKIGEAPGERASYQADNFGEAWLLSLDERWFRCEVYYVSNGPLRVCNMSEPIRAGMSGSPIVLANGVAIGVLTRGVVGMDGSPLCVGNLPGPRLTRDLPGWLLTAAGGQLLSHHIISQPPPPLIRASDQQLMLWDYILD